MALPSNQFNYYDAVGVREDLADLISNISPVDTLFYSSLKEAGADAVKVEWQVDSLASAGTNAHLEGDNETPESVSATTRVYNYTQIQKKVFNISNTLEAVNKAGRKSEVNYQTAKKSKELARDVEYAFLQGSFATPEQGSDSVARKMKGIINWISTNAVTADGGSGAPDDPDEAYFLALAQDIYTSGGNATICYMSPLNARKIGALWTNESTKNYRQLVEDGKVEAYVDVYRTPFGTLQLIPHRLMPNDKVIMLDKEHMGRRGTLRNTHREMLGKTGDNETWVIRVEHTLRNVNEAACGKITNLKTS